MSDSISTPSAPGEAARDGLEPPGGWLIWMVILVELFTFGAALVGFVVSRRDEPQVFAAGRAALNQPLALANTVVLLTGGWMMANAVTSLRRGAAKHASRWILAASGSGLFFLVLKGIEWSQKLHHGLGLHRDSFFMWYWLLTGFHFLHVVVAVFILLALYRGVRGGRWTQADHLDVESGGAFWHLCDLVWLLLYPTVYLLGGAS